MGHSFVTEEVIKPATCSSYGESVKKCERCQRSFSSRIDKVSHNFGEWVVDTEASCNAAGLKGHQCHDCGQIEYASISKLSHQDSRGLNYCDLCGESLFEPRKLTNTEKNNASKVKFIGDRSIQHDDGMFRLFFSFKDSAEKRIKAACIVSVSIINDDDVVVYRCKKQLTEADFSTWTSRLGVDQLLACIEIKDCDILNGSVDSGKIMFMVYNELWTFDASELYITGDLPTQPIEIEYPNLPITVYDMYWDGSIDTGVSITAISFEETYIGVELHFNGEKIYDRSGNNNNDYCIFDWKLYDQEEYVIDSGSVFTSQLKVGEKFRDETSYVRGVKKGTKYKLVLSNHE